jgi:hypothetical protein
MLNMLGAVEMAVVDVVEAEAEVGVDEAEGGIVGLPVQQAGIVIGTDKGQTLDMTTGMVLVLAAVEDMAETVGEEDMVDTEAAEAGAGMEDVVTEVTEVAAEVAGAEVVADMEEGDMVVVGEIEEGMEEIEEGTEEIEVGMEETVMAEVATAVTTVEAHLEAIRVEAPEAVAAEADTTTLTVMVVAAAVVVAEEEEGTADMAGEGAAKSSPFLTHLCAHVQRLFGVLF